MGKKLLVFSLAFGLSLILLQFLKPKIQTESVELVSSPTISNNFSPFQTNKQISLNNSSSFKDLVQKFKVAVAQNDKETAASLINFPLTVGFMDKKAKPYFKEIKNSDEFLANYDKIFDDSFKKCINEMKLDQVEYKSRHEASNYSAVKINQSIYSFKIEMIGYKIDNQTIGVKIANISRGFIIYTSENSTVQQLF